jgi:hypothetical protein
MKARSSRIVPSYMTRRGFLAAGCAAAVAPRIIGQMLRAAEPGGERKIAPAGPGSRYAPTLEVAFVRRKEDYGILWPGAIYDGEAALSKYREKIQERSTALGLKANLRPDPVYSLEEAEKWLAECGTRKPDGLLVVLLDRQKHAWPTAEKAVDSGIPTVVFAPVGAAFTTNTAGVARKPNCFVCSTDDFEQVELGMRMVCAKAKLREMRFIVLQGNEKKDASLDFFGTKLRYLPARTFLEEYRKTPLTGEIRDMAAEYVKGATGVAGPTLEDVQNGVKSYVVARAFLEREEGDGITMDCLGALGNTEVSLPCIAWSRLLDHGIPAACEADLGAAVTHAMVQLLFDKPGFQQDPVPETARECLIGAHCTCPTRLGGFSNPPEPYDLSYHHGKRDAVPRPVWKVGQRITVADVVFSKKDTSFPQVSDIPPELLISTGTVVQNLSVPPSGGCVVSVEVKLDGVVDLLDYPGFHQLFFFGKHRRDLLAYCRMFGIEAQVV